MLSARDSWCCFSSTRRLFVVLPVIIFLFRDPRSSVFSWILINYLILLLQQLLSFLRLQLRLFFIVRLLERANRLELFLISVKVANRLRSRHNLLWSLLRNSSNVLSFIAVKWFESWKLLSWTHGLRVCLSELRLLTIKTRGCSNGFNLRIDSRLRKHRSIILNTCALVILP
jgi:hypothetical protein